MISGVSFVSMCFGHSPFYDLYNNPFSTRTGGAGRMPVGARAWALDAHPVSYRYKLGVSMGVLDLQNGPRTTSE